MSTLTYLKVLYFSLDGCWNFISTFHHSAVDIVAEAHRLEATRFLLFTVLFLHKCSGIQFNF